MATDKKILKALKSAVMHLENSMQALNKNTENLLTTSVWHGAAELEYALFLFSITLQDEVDKSKWKLNPKLKKLKVGPALAAAQDLLTEAERCMAKKKLLDAYKNAYIARHYLLTIQKDFAKKKRDAFKKR